MGRRREVAKKALSHLGGVVPLPDPEYQARMKRQRMTMRAKKPIMPKPLRSFLKSRFGAPGTRTGTTRQSRKTR